MYKRNEKSVASANSAYFKKKDVLVVPVNVQSLYSKCRQFRYTMGGVRDIKRRQNGCTLLMVCS